MTEKNCTELIHCQSEVSISCIHFKSSEKTQTNTQKNQGCETWASKYIKKNSPDCDADSNSSKISSYIQKENNKSHRDFGKNNKISKILKILFH